MLPNDKISPIFSRIVHKLGTGENVYGSKYKTVYAQFEKSETRNEEPES